MSISNIQPSLTSVGISDLQSKQKTDAATNSNGLSFSNMLDSLSKSQSDSDSLIQKLAAGEEVDLHNVMIATEQTDISFRIAIAMRDRLVEAYREVTRMAV